jgi:hypothetical protein
LLAVRASSGQRRHEWRPFPADLLRAEETDEPERARHDGSVLIALTLLVLGRRLRDGHDYRLVAGDNRALSEEKRKYDIEGLADHLASGRPIANRVARASRAWPRIRGTRGEMDRCSSR